MRDHFDSSGIAGRTKAPVAVALIAAPEKDLRAVSEKLSDKTRFHLREFLSMDAINERLATYKFEVLIARHRQFGAAQLKSLESLRVKFPKAAFISLVRDAVPEAVYEARNLPMHKIIYETTELHDLEGVVEKLQRRELSSLRLHPRASRAGPADILLMNDVGDRALLTWRARFLDFSKMGARLAIAGHSKLEQGCRVQFHYQSSVTPTRLHRLETKVIWERTDSAKSSDKQTIAIRFIAAL